MDFASSFTYLLDVLGEDVTINTTQAKTLVESETVNENHDDKIISSLFFIQTGDLITYHDQKWLIISEVNGKRTTGYAGLMRKCDFEISVKVAEGTKVQTGTTPWGEPIYETTDPVYVNADSIIDNEKISISSGGAINVAENKLNIMIQDNTDTQQLALNQTFNVVENGYKIIGFDRTKPGLLIVKAQKGA